MTTKLSFPRLPDSEAPSIRTRVRTHRFIGGLLALLGAVVMLGWCLRLPPLVEILPRFPAMVFDTALSFALAGVALLVPLADPVRHARITGALGALLGTVAGLVLAEHLLQVDLGVDWQSLLPVASAAQTAN